MSTSDPDIFAAGDVAELVRSAARPPDPGRALGQRAGRRPGRGEGHARPGRVLRSRCRTSTATSTTSAWRRPGSRRRTYDEVVFRGDGRRPDRERSPGRRAVGRAAAVQRPCRSTGIVLVSGDRPRSRPAPRRGCRSPPGGGSGSRGRPRRWPRRSTRHPDPATLQLALPSRALRARRQPPRDVAVPAVELMSSRYGSGSAPIATPVAHSSPPLTSAAGLTSARANSAPPSEIQVIARMPRIL